MATSEIKEDNKEAVSEPKVSRRDAFLGRLKKNRPDLNADNEDELYGAINDDYDSYDRQLGEYKANNDKLIGAFNKDPRIAELFTRMAKGENPLSYLIESFGEDEIRGALDDPAMKDKLVEAQNKYLERQTSEKKLEEEASVNLPASLDALEEAVKELGCGEEEADKAFSMFVQIQDDAIVDKVSKETWLMFLKGIMHDGDVEDASHVAEVKGRNAKIEEKLKAPETKMPPSLSGGGSMSEEPKKKPRAIEGALGRYGGKGGSIWD